MYTLKEISSQLGVSVAALRGYIDEGRLAATHVGRSYRVTEEALRSFLGAGRGTQAETAAPPAEDPILEVIGLGEDGDLSRDLDDELYG